MSTSLQKCLKDISDLYMDTELRQGIYCPRCLEVRTKSTDPRLNKCQYCGTQMKDSIIGAVEDCYIYCDEHPEVKESAEFDSQAFQWRTERL